MFTCSQSETVIWSAFAKIYVTCNDGQLINIVQNFTMDSDQQEIRIKETEYGLVKSLQQLFFPITSAPKISSSPGGYLMNLVLKQNLFEDDEENADELCLMKKDSKDLFAVIKEPSSTIQPARWPAECQVLDEKVRHIYYVPSVPEPYYLPNGREVQPKPVGEELGMIVYQYYPISAVNYFCRSSVNGSRYLLETCPTPEEESLKFESRFESGNLAKAIKITAIYYELYLRTDLYTNKHMQWFYFKVTHMKKGIVYRFSIVNMTKDESLYNDGMKPLLYSTKDAQLHNVGWRRCGDNITYFCNENVGPEDPDQVMTYSLTFTLEFPHDDDEVYLAYCYPYTYTDLQDYLLDLSKHPVKSTYTSLRLLCKTLAGNNLYYVTVTAPQDNSEIKRKKAIVVTARVHPGETPASWMMKGFLDFLTGDSGPAKELREKFIFKLVPMLNPDGVIVGNTRCSLTGKDLNRQYRTVIRETYPSIWYTKLLIKRMLEECGVAMYCDLHAHSRKHNIFIYGCENRRGLDRRLGEQVFPLMLHKNSADKFSFESCKFRIQRCKEGTGRVVMWMMGIPNSFTMEASFAGSRIGNRAETHFTVQDYELMGRSFCQTLLDFYDDDPRKERLRTKIVERLLKKGSNADEPTNIPLSDYSSDEGDTSDSSSDEVGREDFTTPLTVPPPSPIVISKRTVKTAQPKIKRRVHKESRKPLPMYRTNIDVALPPEKKNYFSSSNSTSDSEDLYYNKKIVQKRRVKKRTRKKFQPSFVKDELTEDKSPCRSLSVLDLLPVGKLRANQKHHSTYLQPSKHPVESRHSRSVSRQLIEVQYKLTSLKNRLWLGMNDGDTSLPLSWGISKISELDRSSSKRLSNNRAASKSASKPDKLEKKDEKSAKPEVEKVAKKKQNGLRRQTALGWFSPRDHSKVRKSKSLPDTASQKSNDVDIRGCDDNNAKKEKSKKKHKKHKLHKKSSAIKNANIFIKRSLI
ncbi:hypothetical protein PPYR_07035 [Photinus pyralis]|uniref:Peptidase M14 domain-containing protein n=1 Tax=Photinus pyralis TaxID=7054 RepID=A0A5N4AP84_PHOPY|nr:hypothetical protein PPYR_07035 [Photinus pyralis]